MGERMNATLKLLVPIVFVSVIGLVGGVHAEKRDGASQQQEIKQMMEMLEKSGMDPKQMQQMQDMFKGMEGQGRRQSSVKLKKEQQKFEAETVGHGTAQVELNGKQYNLTMTQCKITDRRKIASKILITESFATVYVSRQNCLEQPKRVRCEI